MMSLIELKTTQTIEMSPQKMAEMFLALDNLEQADFFEALAEAAEKESQTNTNMHTFGEMQWLYMTDEIKKRGGKTLECFLSFCAYAYDWFQPAEKWRIDSAIDRYEKRAAGRESKG